MDEEEVLKLLMFIKELNDISRSTTSEEYKQMKKMIELKSKPGVPQW